VGVTHSRHDTVSDTRSPAARSDEQEHAGGRPASTPVAVTVSVLAIVTALFVVALAIVVAAYQLA
jgi:hypothetical protein